MYLQTYNSPFRRFDRYNLLLLDINISVKPAHYFFLKLPDIRYLRSYTSTMTDIDIEYYVSCVYSVYSVMRNNISVGDHVTALSYQLLSLWLASIA